MSVSVTLLAMSVSVSKVCQSVSVSVSVSLTLLAMSAYIPSRASLPPLTALALEEAVAEALTLTVCAAGIICVGVRDSDLFGVGAAQLTAIECTAGEST